MILDRYFIDNRIKMIVGLIMLSIFLGVISIIFILNNFVIHYYGSSKGIVNMLIIGFIIVALFFALNGACQGFAVQSRMAYLRNVKNINPNKIQIMQEYIKVNKKSTTMSVILGYGCLLGSYAILDKVKSNAKKNSKKRKDKWKYNDF